MIDLKERPVHKAHRSSDSGSFTVDGSYIKSQAKEAVRTFVAPFTGVIRALSADKPKAGSKKAGQRLLKAKYYSKKRLRQRPAKRV